MAIPEEQLKTWSKQGSVPQSAATYQAIKAVLEDKNAPYHAKRFEPFLQGSYGNDTNVWKDSDVDIVMRLDSVYYSDLDFLTPEANANFEKARDPAQYSFDQWKADVLAWLQKKYPGAVTPGNKAIFIKGNGNRRDADVVVCCQLRRWWESSNGVDDKFTEGICFFLPDGTRIENFPERHMANCTQKHQDTDEWFKKVVRVYKNMRNRMIEDGVLAEGIAPSYYLEGMLWNVPDDKFGTSFDASFVNTYNWVIQAERDKLVTASGMHWLVRNGQHTSWPVANFDVYLAAAGKFWTEWGS
ncbi:MAG: nucleotidyltransferase [Burkholderiales bacterium]|nr:nucleotidyltransferase [Burkholderiales bacterium]